MKRRADFLLLRILAITVGCIVLLIGGCKLAVWYLLEPTHDVDDFEDVVEDYKSWVPKSYAFLPDQIDADAKQAAFYHLTGYMQGGDILALRLELPPEKVAAILRDLERSGRTEIPGHKGIALSCYPQYDYLWSIGDGYFEALDALPPGFRIFVLEPEMASPWAGGENDFAFTAVSPERREVVYYVALW